ncbi:MAG TPA: hypothetical protein VGO36_07565 [Solirubrobacterales bacterium]|jgi:hypothetical protein|nr:hypothetical protein [Solirubrobacterales bacterium]
MKSSARTRLAAAGAATAVTLLLAGAAQASEIDLKCGGKGARNADSAGTVLCAAQPGQARVVTGVLSNDAGKPVAGKVTATVANWIPAGGGAFSIKPESTQTIAAGANGQFSFSVKTATKVSVYFEAVADEKLGILPFKAQADVSRQLAVTLKKLGGGKLKLTVKGAGTAPLKLYILDSSGYELSGVPAKKANKAGSATFDLGSMHGEFSYYVDAGVLGDLFWEGTRATFKL